MGRIAAAAAGVALFVAGPASGDYSVHAARWSQTVQSQSGDGIEKIHARTRTMINYLRGATIDDPLPKNLILAAAIPCPWPDPILEGTELLILLVWDKDANGGAGDSVSGSELAFAAERLVANGDPDPDKVHVGLDSTRFSRELTMTGTFDLDALGRRFVRKLARTVWEPVDRDGEGAFGLFGDRVAEWHCAEGFKSGSIGGNDGGDAVFTKGKLTVKKPFAIIDP